MFEYELLTPNIKDLVTVARFAVPWGSMVPDSALFSSADVKAAPMQGHSSALRKHCPSTRRWSYTNCRIADSMGTVPSADSSQVRCCWAGSVCAGVGVTLQTPMTPVDIQRTLTALLSPGTSRVSADLVSEVG